MPSFEQREYRIDNSDKLFSADYACRIAPNWCLLERKSTAEWIAT